MLLKVKISELYRHLEYLQNTCELLSSSAYPNLALRLEALLTKELRRHKVKADELYKQIEVYEQASKPGFDTWKQLYGELVELVAEVCTAPQNLDSKISILRGRWKA